MLHKEKRDRMAIEKKKVGAQAGNKNAAGHGAPKGNKNAVGNKGGPGGFAGNQNARKHGRYSKKVEGGGFMLGSSTVGRSPPEVNN
jgi:uncharacterized protein YjcR